MNPEIRWVRLGSSGVLRSLLAVSRHSQSS